MNVRVTINPKEVIRANFKFHFTNILVFHILANYDKSVGGVRLNPKDIIEKYNTSYRSINHGIKELLEKSIISKKENYKYWYKVNNKFLIEVIEK